MTQNELNELFRSFEPTRRPIAKKVAPIDPLVQLQKSLDELTGTGANRIDLSKTDAKTPAGKKEVILKQTDKRDLAFQLATGDESLGTRSNREIAGGKAITKSAREDAIVLHGGFVSRGDLTGVK